MAYKPKTWMQEKILSEKGYTPYCGNIHCNGGNPRTLFATDSLQFFCPCCGWMSKFPKECMEEYKKLNDL